MTDLTAREVVEKLHQYDDLPSFPKINIHFLATAPGNEHLLKFMTDKPDNPIRFKGKRIGIIATHGVEETEVSIKRRVSDRERNTRAGPLSPLSPPIPVVFPPRSSPHGLEARSALPVARSTGTETCSWTISHLPLALRRTSVTRILTSIGLPSFRLPATCVM